MTNTSAVGVGVSPANMTFDAHVGITDSQSLFVINDGQSVSDYRVYVDDQYVDWFTISPNNFTLHPEEHKEVIISLKAPISANGNYDMKAYVIASAPSSNFEVGSGIKIPIKMNVSNKGLFFASGAIVILVIGMIATGTTWKKNRRQTRMNVNAVDIRIADVAVESSVVDEDEYQADSGSDLEGKIDSIANT
ncbi:hypothetical protein [Methanolobus psychrotolerans]|uniref:hypothetical protein n=1 Tax=Methanolobus psychrotolerans TaxID=1874706 RepID=UPI000B919349|nr:hypothetical protein [Methanolobus psychrotolerans]